MHGERNRQSWRDFLDEGEGHKGPRVHQSGSARDLLQDGEVHQAYLARCRRPQAHPATAAKRGGGTTPRHPASGTGKPGIGREARDPRRCVLGEEVVGLCPANSDRSSGWFRKSWRRWKRRRVRRERRL